MSEPVSTTGRAMTNVLAAALDNLSGSDRSAARRAFAESTSPVLQAHDNSAGAGDRRFLAQHPQAIGPSEPSVSRSRSVPAWLPAGTVQGSAPLCANHPRKAVTCWFAVRCTSLLLPPTCF